MMRETSCFSLSQVAVNKTQKTQKTQQLLLTKAPNCLRFAGSTINRYRPYRERSNSLLKSRALQQRVSFFKFFERLLLNNGDGIQHYAHNFNIWTVLEQQTRRRALQQNIAIFSKPDYILLILTRNQLPSIVSEGTKTEATVMELGVNTLANFPLPSPFFFWLRQFAETFWVLLSYPEMARRVCFRAPPGNPLFLKHVSRLDKTMHHNFKVTSMSCMNHTIIKTYTSNSGIFSVCGNKHQGVTYLVAASVTLIKLNRALHINKKATSKTTASRHEDRRLLATNSQTRHT